MQIQTSVAYKKADNFETNAKTILGAKYVTAKLKVSINENRKWSCQNW